MYIQSTYNLTAEKCLVTPCCQFLLDATNSVNVASYQDKTFINKYL